MTQQTEWELVDETGPRDRYAETGAGSRQTPHLLQALLGRHWRWKLAGWATLGVVVLACLITFAGVVMIAAAAVAIVMAIVAQLQRWLFAKRRADIDLRRSP